jgi:hypothetical protein
MNFYELVFWNFTKNCYANLGLIENGKCNKDMFGSSCILQNTYWYKKCLEQTLALRFYLHTGISPADQPFS